MHKPYENWKSNPIHTPKRINKKQIEQTHISEVTIKYFYKVMDNFQSQKLIIIFVNSNNKIQAGVSVWSKFCF